MLKGKKAVIFDMDGSLVDSMWVWLEVDRIYMEKHNITEPETFHKDIEGMSYIETAQYFVDTFQTLNRTREEVMQDWRDMAVELYATKVFPKPGAVEFLDEMKRRGVLLGIATSNDRKIAQAALDAGYDMFLTANNHCGDTTADGILRTLEQSRGVGLKTLGTQMNDEEKKFEIVDVNGIKIGMIAYTYATSVTSDGRPSLNGNAALSQVGIVNYFMENNLEAFYTELEQRLAQMKQDGAEATIVYLHWGVEYLLEENSTQRAIAQKLCDLGVDVIIGGHPHVVEPIDLLESTVDPNHKSVILYSMGNAVSNQRQGNLSMISTAHTEDGVLFAVTFEKYSDGTVYLAGAEVVPTWVNMHSNNGSREYNILPLDIDKKEAWTSLFNLTQANYDAAVKSYDRTMEIVGEGLTECQTWLEQAKTDRENYYLELARNPGMTQQTQPTVAETIAEETTLPAAA